MQNVNVELIKDEMSDKIISTVENLVTNAGEVTVRDVLRALNITNRVFYNRFHNIEDVLQIVYVKTAVRIRESFQIEYDGNGDFFDYVTDVVVQTLVASYDIKMKFNKYVFENDSLSPFNYEWYMNKIRQLFELASKLGKIKDLDVETMSYAIWCFCRGYNADAVMRMDKDQAVQKLKYSFRIMLDGLKK